MKTSISHRHNRNAFALLLVMFTMVSMIMILGSVMLWISSSTKQTAKNISYTSAEAAAEGATEMAFAKMDKDFLLNSLFCSPASYYNTVASRRDQLADPIYLQ